MSYLIRCVTAGGALDSTTYVLSLQVNALDAWQANCQTNDYLPSLRTSLRFDQYLCIPVGDKVRKRIAVCATSTTPLWELTCHMGSHSITCHPAEVTFPPLPQPIKAGTRFSDPRGMQG